MYNICGSPYPYFTPNRITSSYYVLTMLFCSNTAALSYYTFQSSTAVISASVPFSLDLFVLSPSCSSPLELYRILKLNSLSINKFLSLLFSIHFEPAAKLADISLKNQRRDGNCRINPSMFTALLQGYELQGLGNPST